MKDKKIVKTIQTVMYSVNLHMYNVFKLGLINC